ncbi:MAG TPA: NADP-dependent oxidoreductase [Burkholderiales bacterium]
MKAAFIRRYGGPEVLDLGEQPVPSPGPDDLQVEVRAASVNPIDFKTRAGETKVVLSYKFPLILGNDLSGVVKAVGPRVTRFKPGDEIYARLHKDRIGSFAEVALVRESAAALKPANTTHEEAASLPLVGLTCWQALLDIARLERGQKVLIHAGAGGIGTFAIQLAHHLGAVVTTTASARNAELVKQLGADVVIDYKTQRFEDVCREQDVVFDTIGGETRHRSFAAMRRGGVMVSIAGMPDAKWGRDFGMNPIMVLALGFLSRKTTRLARKHGVRFEFLFMRADGQQLGEIAKLVERGIIRPVVGKVFPLDRIREALAYSESGRATGKIVIRIGGSAQ